MRSHTQPSFFRTRFLIPLAAVLLFTGCILSPESEEKESRMVTGTWQGKQVRYMEGQIVVALVGGVSPTDVADLVGNLHLTFMKDWDVLNTALVEIPENADLMTTIEHLNHSPKIWYAEPNLIISIQEPPGAKVNWNRRDS